MKAILTRIEEKQSKHGGVCYLLLFRDLNGNTYKSWIYKSCNNFKNWEYIIENRKLNSLLDNLRIKESNLIDGDSRPKIIKTYSNSEIQKIKQENSQEFCLSG